MAGYVAISLLLDAHAALSILIINVGYEFFDILTWVLFVDAAHRHNQNALHVFGLGVAFMFAGMAFGNTASQAIHGLVASGAVQMNMVAMVAVLCLVIIAFLVLPEGTMAQLSSSLREARKEGDKDGFGTRAGEVSAAASEAAGSGSVLAEGRIERQCALVTSAYKLTPRESEVIVLLAYGRTLAIIAPLPADSQRHRAYPYRVDLPQAGRPQAAGTHRPGGDVSCRRSRAFGPILRESRTTGILNQENRIRMPVVRGARRQGMTEPSTVRCCLAKIRCCIRYDAVWRLL